MICNICNHDKSDKAFPLTTDKYISKVSGEIHIYTFRRKVCKSCKSKRDYSTMMNRLITNVFRK